LHVYYSADVIAINFDIVCVLETILSF